MEPNIQEAQEVADELGVHFKGPWHIPGHFHDFLFTDTLTGTTFHVDVDEPDLFSAALHKLQRKRDAHYFNRLKARADQGEFSALIEAVALEQMIMKL